MSKKTERIHGQPMSTKPYKIIQQTNTGLMVTVPKLTGLKAGEFVYVEKFDNGCVLLIPKKLN
jgi:phage regulator Rha-like protein